MHLKKSAPDIGISMRKITDENKKIVEGLKNGDKEVFEDLYKQHYVPLCYYCVKYVERLEDAEEIVQDVFVKLWDKHKETTINTSVVAYLHKAVQNNALNYLNKRKIVDRYMDAQDGKLKHSFDDGQKILEDDELRLVLKKAILELPEKRREIFEMSRFEDMKYSTIADQLSISVKTVENQMSKALKYLRVVLKEYSPVVVAAVEFYRRFDVFN